MLSNLALTTLLVLLTTRNLGTSAITIPELIGEEPIIQAPAEVLNCTTFTTPDCSSSRSQIGTNVQIKYNEKYAISGGVLSLRCSRTLHANEFLAFRALPDDMPSKAAPLPPRFASIDDAACDYDLGISWGKEILGDTCLSNIANPIHCFLVGSEKA